MKWRILKEQSYSAAMNMAIDEAVAQSVAANKSPPTIRFYSWKPAAVSIGYFQRILDEIDVKECEKHGIDIVRRQTGGGAVFHDDEITYSIIAPEKLMPDGITESYDEICGYIVNALKQIGIQSEFKPINDIVTKDAQKKISGNAQTRRNGILLQHGTILYNVDVKKMFSLLKVPDEKIRDKLIAAVEERVTCITNECESTKKELLDSLQHSFTQGKEFVEGELSQEELEAAKDLAQEKYSSKEWNYSR